MSMTEKEHIDFIALVVKAQEGALSAEEKAQLKSCMDQPRYRKLYFAAVKVNCALRQVDIAESTRDSEPEAIPSIDIKLLEELAESERQAPRLERTDKTDETPHKVIRPAVEKRKMSRFRKLTLSACAAIILLLISLNFLSQKTYSLDVATVTDQMNVKWLDSRMNIKNGDRLYTNKDLLRLDKGLLSIQFDEGVGVVVEGPAQFAVERSGVYLEYGRLYGLVSDSGLGFTVDTPKARYVDQGTEFGVQADIDGSSELHVLKGKVQLFGGLGHDARYSRIVTESQAVKYDAATGATNPIPVTEKAFVRSIDSQSGTVWRGETQISLADIVGGGNGFGTGKLDSGIKTSTGKRFILPDRALVQSKTPGIQTVAEPTYNKVSEIDAIDGVFVPDSRKEPVQVTSAGDVFGGFEYGRGVFWGEIFNGAWHASDKVAKHNLKLGGITWGTEKNPAISMHSNQGITFDLSAIRRTVPGVKVLRFTALFGVSETVAQVPYYDPKPDLNEGKANCWVLLDGKPKFNRDDVTHKDGAIEIAIDLTDSDRFLTLVVTESNDRRAFDWALFAKPALQIEEVNE